MIQSLKFKRLKTKLTFWLTLVAVIPVISVSLVIYHQRVKSIKEEAFTKLSAIRDMKTEMLNQWIKERVSDLHTVSEDMEIRGASALFAKAELTPENHNLMQTASMLLNRAVQNYAAYHEMFIVNPIDGKVRLSTLNTSLDADRSGEPYVTGAMATQALYIRDIYYSKTLRGPSMIFALPVYAPGPEKSITGILVARIDLRHSLYALLSKRTGMGATGETLLVNTDVVAVTPLRWHEDAPLNLKIQAKPAVQAARGNTGIVETEDYRGESVLAAYTFISRTRWGVVAKQDLTEVYAPIRPMLVNILVLVLGAVVAVGIISVFLARTISLPVLEMARVSRKIEEGDFSIRNHLITADELGELARTMNTMADAIDSQLHIQKAVSDTVNITVKANDVQEFADQLLNHLIHITGSQMGAFYVHRENRVYEPMALVGVDAALAVSFEATGFEGEIGRVLKTRSITVIENIPEDTRFVFKTFSGTFIPRAMICIPLLVNGNVAAVVSLAGVAGYAGQALAIIDQVWAGLNTAMANHLANAQTRRLAEELGQKNQELEAQSEELHSLNEEQRRQARELEQQNIELVTQRRQVEEANRLKSEFLSNMSHELRTPLNSVMALSKVLMLQSRDRLTPEEIGYLEIIERNGRHLLSLINDILDLSKIEAGRMSLDIKPVRIRQLISTVVESLLPMAREKSIRIDNQLPNDLPTIHTDEFKLHQIFQNIIGNAVKFTEKGGITLSARADDSLVRIAVTDTGIGLPENELPHIFEEFRQVDGSTSRKYEGTGLGLAIARKLARLLGGDISVDSLFGRGSTFTLHLPLDRSVPAMASNRDPSPPSAKPAGKTVLIVDDDPRIRQLLQNYISGEGYATLSAATGKEAIEMARSHLPFAVTLDVVMPDMDGWEVLQQLKQSPATAHIPVIIVSITGDRQTGFALGAVGYLTKPVERASLTRELAKLQISGQSILVVDDNPIDRRYAAEVLEKEGFQVTTAGDGPTCLDLIAKAVPDLLILDLMMPGMDGFAVLEHIRAGKRTRHLPVVVVTAKDLTPEDKQRLSHAATRVIAKSERLVPDLLEDVYQSLSRLAFGPEIVDQPSAGGNKRLLLVEDNPAAVIQIQSILKGQGLDVDVAANGLDAIDYVRHTIPDGIILDLMMPGIDGFDVLDKIRTSEKTAHIPVLILTAKDLTVEDLGRLKHNHVRQLVQKGNIDREGLIEKINHMLRPSVLPPAVYPEPRTPAAGPGPLPRSGGGLPEILVIEDNRDNRITLQAILKTQYHVTEARDGETGLTLIAQMRPDLVLLDILLPKMDGYAVVRQVKQDPALAAIPIIALTANAMKGDREKILAAGCDDYIAKPINPEDLLARIQNWLKGGRNAEDSDY